MESFHWKHFKKVVFVKSYLYLMLGQSNFIVENLSAHCTRRVHMSFHMFSQNVRSRKFLIAHITIVGGRSGRPTATARAATNAAVLIRTSCKQKR